MKDLILLKSIVCIHSDFMSKIFFLLAVACSSILNVNCQTETFEAFENKKAIGFSVGYGLLGTFWGAAHTIQLGLDYSLRYSEKWSFCSGIENFMFPDVARTIKTPEITTIPVLLKQHGKYVCFSFGPLLNFWGLFSISQPLAIFVPGWEFSIVLEHEFDNGVTLFIKPYSRINGLLGGIFDIGRINGHQFTQIGVNLGLRKSVLNEK